MMPGFCAIGSSPLGVLPEGEVQETPTLVTIDALKIPLERRVVFEGSIRVVSFDGNIRKVVF